MTMKRCSKCGDEKPRGDFNKETASVDGLQSRCKECSRRQSKLRYDALIDSERARRANYRSANIEKVTAYEKANAIRFAAKKRTQRAASTTSSYSPRDAERSRVDRLKNPEKYRIRFATWRKANLHKDRARSSHRLARKRHATPVWANKEKIDAYYKSADALGMLTGEWYHVDHIVPLLGETVCGLHNEFNLQILTAFENLSKGNRHWPDQP